MARFRRRPRGGSGKAETRLIHSGERGRRERLEQQRRWTRQQAAQWALLRSFCPTKESRARLVGLISRLTGADRSTRESALAELELATLLIRAGFEVEILGESHAKSADLVCRLGARQMYVEVTALLGSLRRPPPSFSARMRRLELEGTEASHHVLLARLAARICRKAAQLAHYTSPVVLAASVPPPAPLEFPQGARAELPIDLGQAAASVTLLLARIPSISAVLVTLWHADPLPARSAVRLTNVHIVERSTQQAAYPRVRMLIVNPQATYRLSGTETTGLTQIL